MSSDLFVHEDSSLFRCSNSDLVFPSDAELQFFSDPYSPFSDSAIDILQAISDHSTQENPLDESHSFVLSSSSPPSHQLESLSLCQRNDLHLLPNDSSSNGFQNLSGFEVKNEESYVPFSSDSYTNHPLEPVCFDGADNVDKLLQRSYSEKPGFGFQSRFESLLMESPNFQNQSIVCPETDFFSSQIRRVFSTGDLQNSGMGPSGQRSFSSPLSENSLMEEANFKVGRYSAEERKERISKYRAKRTQRNFNKTIKYACRKTLADNRPRIRGRFARNDEPGEIPKAACSTREEDEDDFWMEGLHAGGGEEGTVRGKQFGEVYGRMQFQYCGFRQ